LLPVVLKGTDLDRTFSSQAESPSAAEQAAEKVISEDWER